MGGPPGCPGGVGRAPRKSGRGQKGPPEIREGSRGQPGSPGGVGIANRKFRIGREGPLVVLEGSE